GGFFAPPLGGGPAPATPPLNLARAVASVWAIRPGCLAAACARYRPGSRQVLGAGQPGHGNDNLAPTCIVKTISSPVPNPWQYISPGRPPTVRTQNLAL
ncbi:MAG: hypothetical protein OXH93_16690, partial [Caldilineaceae bacterium]|nr:hypothetical protein [Caldilineaceae bacterium]